MVARVLLASCVVWLVGCGDEAGELSTQALERVVADNRPSLEPCYQRALDGNPYKHPIRIQAIIEIEPSGRVAKVELDQTGLSGMAPCIKQTIGSWSFPQARKTTRTELPLIFEPKVVKQRTR